MKTKRILLISSQFSPSLDGVGHYTHHLGRALEKEYEVFYINQQILAIDHWDFKAWRLITREVKKIQPDLISLQYVPFGYHKKGLPFYLLLFWFKLKLKGYFLQVTFHEVAIGYNLKSIRQSIGALLQRFIAWSLCILSQHIFTSVGLYRKMLLPFNKNTQQVFIGANFPVQQKNYLKESQTLKICSFNNRITFDLLCAVKELVDLGKNLVLVGIGKINKEQQHEILKYIKDLDIEKYVEIRAEDSDIDISSILNQSDIYVQMEWTNKKGSGGLSLKSGTLMAAMGTGLPIVSTFGQMTDVNLLSAEQGILFVSQRELLFDLLNRLLKNSDLRKELGKKSYYFFIKYCTWNIVGLHYKKLLND